MIELWWNEQADLLDIVEPNGLIWRQSCACCDWYSFEINEDDLYHREVTGWYRIGEL